MTTPRPAPRVDPPTWDLPDRLRAIRTKVARMDQAEFAQALGLTRPAYQSYEGGRHSPRDVVAVAKRIELLTGVAAAWVLGIDSAGPVTDSPDGGSFVTQRDRGINPPCSTTAGGAEQVPSTLVAVRDRTRRVAA